MARQRLEPIAGLFCRVCGSESMSKKSGDLAQSGKIRYKCGSCGSRTTTPFKTKPQLHPKFKKTKSKRYIVTSVMSECPLNHEMWDTLVKMSEILDARLIAKGTVETNPNLSTRGSPLIFPSESLEYLCMERFDINKNLVVRGDYSIEHSVITPLTSANNCSGTQSEIFGHAQVALKMVPTPKDSIPKGMYTTGTVSMPKYKNSARAKRAEHHHSFSALFVEVSGDTFWPTQLRWDQNKKCIELFGKEYSKKGAKKAKPLAGIVYGDIHYDVMTKQERDLFWRLCKGAKAKKNVICDVLDFHSGSHHNEGDVIRNMRKPDFDIEGEVQRAASFVKSVPNCVLVSSNHHDHLDKWYNRQDRRKLRHELGLYDKLTGLVRQYDTDLFAAWCLNMGAKMDLTHPNREYDIGGIDVSQHGHIGPNGARGSLAAFSKTGRKTILQHSHTPGIDKGSMQVGTSSMSHDYARGYSSWAIAHALITSGGKRSLVFALKGKYSPMMEDWLSER